MKLSISLHQGDTLMTNANAVFMDIYLEFIELNLENSGRIISFWATLVCLRPRLFIIILAIISIPGRILLEKK